MCIHIYDDPSFLGRLLGLSAAEELISSIVCLFGLDSLLVGDFLIRLLVGGWGNRGSVSVSAYRALTWVTKPMKNGNAGSNPKLMAHKDGRALLEVMLRN